MTEERLNPLTWLQGKFASLVHTHTKSDITDLGTIPSTSSAITDSNTYSNIGNTAQTQESINGAINTKLGELVDIHLVQYELSSSNYNPTIDSTITITCTCKDILGNPIPNKELELMLNGGSVGTSTTNENGIATFTVTFGGWGNKHFYIGNATLDLTVNGYRKISVTTGELYVNDLTKTAVYKFQRVGTVPSKILYSGVIPKGYRPSLNVRMKAHNSSVSIFIIIETNGDVILDGGTASTSINITGQITYAYGTG